jgi:hypothetical protein
VRIIFVVTDDLLERRHLEQHTTGNPVHQGTQHEDIHCRLRSEGGKSAVRLRLMLLPFPSSARNEGNVMATRSKHPAHLAPALLRNSQSTVEQQLGPIQYRPLLALTAYKDNPRKHPERQIVQLAASITEFGFTIPVLIDAGGFIIAGHARIEAARRLGMTEVPILTAEH